MTSKKIIVTGALGHIGSHLIRSLPSAFPDSTIICIDNMLCQRYCSLFNLPANGKYRFIEGDILSADLDSIFSGAQVVIHLAAITDAANSFSNEEVVNKTNYEGTKRIADACIKNTVPLIFLSTTSVYGTQKEIVDEFCSKEELAPQSPYATSKLKSENFLLQLKKDRDFPFVICRFGTIYGTSIGMRFHTAVNKFCWQAVNGQPITVWKTALNQKRPYLHLDDASNAITHIIQKNLFNGDVYNVLTSNSTVQDIIDVIKKKIPTLSIQLTDNQIMNQLSYNVSNDRFKKTGFTYHGSLKSGIDGTLELLGGISNWKDMGEK